MPKTLNPIVQPYAISADQSDQLDELCPMRSYDIAFVILVC
jgi:hypothetical protein